jgi:hypothetical protein
MKVFVFIFIAILCSSFISPVQAVDVPKNYSMVSCESSSNLACIKSITAKAKDMSPVVSTKPVNSFVANDGRSVETYEEWAFPGLKFEGSSENRLIPRITFRPFGAEQCNFDVCFQGLEEIQVGVTPSWLISTAEDDAKRLMDLSRRGNQYLCGDKNSPTLCYRGFNLNQELVFEIKMLIPLDFKFSAVLGSVKNFNITDGAAIIYRGGIGFREMIIEYQPQKMQAVLFSPQVPNPMDTSNYADYESDNSGFWIVGSRSVQSAKLGKCTTVPFISVLSNSTYQDLPVWNSVNQTIEVNLTAPHFAVSGEIHKGYFEATISKEMGKCLWDIDLSTQVEAKLSIFYPSEGGIEVQTVGGKFDGKNYTLFSSNFHYSSPKVAFRLTQEAKPIAVAATPIKKTIYCTKGKFSKKVTAVSPKCPKGYKLKV